MNVKDPIEIVTMQYCTDSLQHDVSRLANAAKLGAKQLGILYLDPRNLCTCQ